jgi:hypothetical protein
MAQGARGGCWCCRSRRRCDQEGAADLSCSQGTLWNAQGEQAMRSPPRCLRPPTAQQSPDQGDLCQQGDCLRGRKQSSFQTVQGDEIFMFDTNAEGKLPERRLTFNIVSHQWTPEANARPPLTARSAVSRMPADQLRGGSPKLDIGKRRSTLLGLRARTRLCRR